MSNILKLAALVIVLLTGLPAFAGTDSAQFLEVNDTSSLHPNARQAADGMNTFHTDNGAQQTYISDIFRSAADTGNTTLLSTSVTVRYGDASGGAFAYTMPAATNAYKLFYIKKTDSSGNAITINRAGSDTFEGGGTSLTLSSQNDGYWLQSDGTSQWKILNLYTTTIPAARIGGGSVSDTEFGYLDGVTSSIQTQLGNKQAADTGLTNLSALTGAGIVSSTATDTYSLRTLTGTSNRLTVTNGTGAGGDPTFDISSSYVGQASITTLGTIGTGVWNGTTIGTGYGGTGITTTPSDGKLLIGNTGGGYTCANLTQGTGITITNGNGSITIASTGGGTGDVVGPSSAGDNSLALYDGTTGKLIKAGVGLGTSGWLLTSAGAGSPPSFQAMDATLVSLAAYNTNGILTQTAADTFTGRTITGTSNLITVTNGSGVSGNPTITIPTTVGTTSHNWTGFSFNMNDTALIKSIGSIIFPTFVPITYGTYAPIRTGTYYTTQLAAPASPGSTVVGSTGSTTYKYVVQAYASNGYITGPASAETSVANGPSVISPSGLVRVTWSQVTGAEGYYIYQTQGSSNSSNTSRGLVGTVTSGATTTYDVQAAPTTFDAYAIATDGSHPFGNSVVSTTSGYGVAMDSGIGRNAAGVLEVNDGILNRYATIKSETLNIACLGTPAYTFGGWAGAGTAGTWTYKVYAVAPSGKIGPATTINVSISPATLNGTDYVKLRWSPVEGASSYKVYRTAVRTSPTTTGLIATVQATSPLSLDDTGLAGDSAVAPTVATSGNILFSTDNIGDIGASGANRPRSLYLGSDANVGGALNVTGTTTLGATTLGGLVTPSAANTYDIGTANIGLRDIYLGGASNFTAKITKTTPTADRTFTIPDNDCVAVVGDSGAANNYISAINPTTGVITKSQPAFSNLSGSATNSQLPTVDVGHGGTGITTTPSNGQIPIGNGTNYTAAAITQGTGITVTNGSGSITIASTAKKAGAARKSADTGRTNNTVTADPDLSIPVGANESWTFTADIAVQSGNATPDLQICFAGPSGSTVLWNGYVIDDTGAWSYISDTAGGTTSVVQIRSATNSTRLHLTCSVSGTYSAGNVTINWAQNTTNANAVNMRAGSSMIGVQQ